MLKQPNKLKVSAKAPSNIAFVKYWGKYGVQLPLNPSISMTLNQCYTHTTWELEKSDKYELIVYLDGELKPGFNSKIEKWFNLLGEDFHFLKNSKSIIHTTNTFPHGTGIASSASGFAALSMCLSLLYSHLYSRELEAGEISHLARLGSGSACRSIEGPYCAWGKSSNEYATSIKDVHKNFMNLKDAICIISNKEKEISSTQGHSMMENHPYKEARIKQAHENYDQLLNAMHTGDLWEFGRILEQEALSLHALMMSSHQSYTLLEANSLELIKKLKLWRNKNKIPVFFTLDAGPNIHLIYSESEEAQLMAFLKEDVINNLIDNIIYDEMGNGAQFCV